MIFAIRNLTMALAFSSMEIFAIPQETNRLTPSGGVDWPMARFTVMMMPK